MYVDFNELPSNSRIWIYQSNKEFSKEDKELIAKEAIEFIKKWTRHGQDLKGSFTIKYNQFLILAVDENFNNVSGCSIDASVHFIQDLEKNLQVDLMNKMNISFKDGNNINIVSMKDFKNFAQQQKITKNTIVFNNMINTKEALETQWEIPASKSWHNRFLV